MDLHHSRSWLFWIGFGAVIALMLSLACNIATPGQPAVDLEGTQIALEATNIFLEVAATEQAQSPVEEPAVPEDIEVPSVSSEPLPAGGPAGLTIRNSTGHALCNLMLERYPMIVYPNEEYLPLMEGETLPDGVERTFTGVEPKVYKLIAAVCSGELAIGKVIRLESATSVTLTPEDIVPQEDLDDINSLVIMNSSSAVICKILIWSVEDQERGRNLILPGSSGLPPGTPIEVGVEDWAYGLMIEPCDGNRFVVDAVDFLSFDFIAWEYRDMKDVSCGNTFCEVGEDAKSCSQDCGMCGDGFCSTKEDSGTCSKDCSSP